MVPVVATGQAAGEAAGFQVRIDPGQPWRPPFGLDRVGRTIGVVVDADARPDTAQYVLSAAWKGKELARQSVTFPEKPPYSARVALEGVAAADEVVVFGERGNGAKPVVLVRQAIRMLDLEADAVARPDTINNPVDLGTILVPSGWLLLGPGQTATLELAAISRRRGPASGPREAHGSNPRPSGWRSSPSPCARPSNANRDETARTPDARRRAMFLPSRWSMVQGTHSGVRRSPSCWCETRRAARASAPLTRNCGTMRRSRCASPRTGKYSSLRYEDGWKPELRDIVVWLPNGSRFVFWRGSSYIPFWAGRHNTGACYEWAEIISQPQGAVDCVEPLMDKELRYGRVEIVEVDRGPQSTCAGPISRPTSSTRSGATRPSRITTSIPTDSARGSSV